MAERIHSSSAQTAYQAATELTHLSPIPLLASTHFCMEVLLRGSVLDLRSVQEVLIFDPCALLRIFAQTAAECPELDGELLRLEERAIAIGVPGLRRALYYVPSSWHQQAALSGFAEHAASTGRLCRIAAEVLGACEETAYLVGLFHELGDLPAVLDGRVVHNTAQRVDVAATLCNTYQVPDDLRHAITSVHEADTTSIWTLIVQAAHELANFPENNSQRENAQITKR